MKKRKLGASGPSVGEIALGCMSFAGFYGPSDEATSHETLSAAIDNGITHLDTANVYGNGVSEEIIGTFIKDNPNRFEIATKGGIWRDENAKRGFNNTREHLTLELDKSLKRLGVDHVALYYIHRRQQDIPIEDVMETMMGFVKAGKIGGIGFSEIAPFSLRRAAAIGPVQAVQSEYSLWTRGPELGMIQACRDVGAAFVPFSPLARGMFSYETPDPSRFGDVDIRKTGPRFQPENFPANVAFFDRFRALSADLDISPAGLSIAWVLDQGEHLIPIPGTRTKAHLEEFVQGSTFEMTDEIRQAIDEIMPVAFAHGDRYSDAQTVGIERYC